MQQSKLIISRLIVLVLALFLVLPGTAAAAKVEEGYETNRATLLGYILRQYLSSYHYSNKAFDDQLSLTAFNAYLQQLDMQKRFLLQEDVDRLEAYNSAIDDELKKGQLELPLVGAKILRDRIAFIQKQLPVILAGPLDFLQDEFLELDPAKLEYCRSEKELQERWRLNLKFQVANRYLTLLEDEGLKDKPFAEIEPAKRQALQEQARERILKNNQEHVSRLLEDAEKEHFNRYFNALARAFDPHTLYMPPVSKEDFDIHMRGSLEGIGARLREEDGFIKVESIVPGSAASRQGQLAAEDIVLKVAQGEAEPVDVTDMRLRDAVGLIRGEKGSEVRLTVRKPDNAIQVIAIVRDVVEIEETFVKSALIPGGNGEVLGYIKIPSFYRDFDSSRGDSRNVTDDTRKAIRELKTGKIKGLVLDLRDNSGGSLNDAVSTAGLFIKQGPVVQVREGKGKIQTLSDQGGKIEYDGPLVILVNRFSASASEIVAGALQDYGRALVIGSDHTHGKGTVQAVIDLDRGVPSKKMEPFKPLGALKITTQKFYRISGESTQSRGVVADIVLPDLFSGIESGEQYLDNSLPWDTIAPVPYTRWTKALPEVNILQQRSSHRVAASDHFAEITERLERARIKRQETSQPLHIEKLRQQRQQEESERQFFSALNPHGEAGERDEKKKGRDWVLGVKEDPYVLEAIAVLKDMALLRSGLLADKTAGRLP
jgi:carboxyl-terminal processing protease